MNPQPRQTLLDIAIAGCGSAEAAPDIALMNGMAIDDDPYQWARIYGPLAMPPAISGQVAQYFAAHSQPATGYSSGGARQGGGINYMGISIDFIVSGTLGGINYMGIEIDFIIS